MCTCLMCSRFRAGIHGSESRSPGQQKVPKWSQIQGAVCEKLGLWPMAGPGPVRHTWFASWGFLLGLMLCLHLREYACIL